MPAESGGAAGLNRRHDFELAKAEVAGMSRPPGWGVSADDVGDLQQGTHGSQLPGLAPSPVRPLIWTMILSSGLVTVRTVLVATRA